MKSAKVKPYSKLARLLFFCGFILLPIIYWPFARIPYEIPKVDLFLLWAEVITALSLIFYARTRSHSPKLTPVLLVLGLISVSIISSIFGTDLTKSFWGNYYRHDGLFTLFHLAGIFFFLALFWDRNWFHSLFYSIVLGAIINSGWILFDGIRLFILGKQSVPNWEGAIGASFGQPNFAAGYLLITLPLCYWLYHTVKKRTRFLILLLFLLQLLAIFLTQSLAASVGIILCLLLFYLVRKHISGKIAWMSVFILVSLLGVFAFLYRERNSGFQPEGRPRIYTKILLGAMRKPLLGWGWANVDYAFNEIPYPMRFEHDIYVDKAHSSILEMFAATGLIGLTIYLALIVYLLQALFRYSFWGENRERLLFQTLLMVFILYLFHSQTNVISIAEELFFWVILGITSAMKE